MKICTKEKKIVEIKEETERRIERSKEKKQETQKAVSLWKLPEKKEDVMNCDAHSFLCPTTQLSKDGEKKDGSF